MVNLIYNYTDQYHIHFNTRTHARTHARTHIHTHTYARAHARTHARMCSLCYRVCLQTSFAALKKKTKNKARRKKGGSGTPGTSPSVPALCQSIDLIVTDGNHRSEELQLLARQSVAITTSDGNQQRNATTAGAPPYNHHVFTRFPTQDFE